MLHLGTQVRLTQAEQQLLERVCGPHFFNPTTVSQFEQLTQQAHDYWAKQGNVVMVEACQGIHDALPH